MSPRMQEAHEQEKIVMQYFVIKKGERKIEGNLLMQCIWKLIYCKRV